MLRKLRFKFVCINMAIVTGMLCVVFALVLNFTRTNLENQSIQMMQAIAAEPMRLGRPDERPDQVRLPYFALQIGMNGEVIAVGGGYYDLSDQTMLADLINAAVASDEQLGVVPDYNLRYYRVATPLGQHIIFADMTSEVSTMNSLIRTCIFIGVIGFLAFLGISLLLARWAVKPVEKAWDQQRQFVADASHELKTPLTVITTNAELLQNPVCSEEERAQFSDNILTVSRQMRGLTESLLDLARVDNGTVEVALSEVDLSQVVEHALLPFEAVFFEKNMMFHARIQEGIRAKASEGHIRQVVDILLDNAQKYACSEAEVWLSLQKTDHSNCVLTVANMGEPISQDDLKHIFKRFYRVDTARSMSRSYGLGLSIAETIVHAHKGRIWAQSGNGINTFFVQLPTL